jgi:hypothetical protein
LLLFIWLAVVVKLNICRNWHGLDYGFLFIWEGAVEGIFLLDRTEIAYFEEFSKFIKIFWLLLLIFGLKDTIIQVKIVG